MNPGDLAGDIFNQPISLPFSFVQYLGGNVSLRDININAGAISSGTLASTPTASTRPTSATSSPATSPSVPATRP